MILVTLGTQDKEFRRLLEKIDELIDKKVIKEKVVVQAGKTKYESKNMEIFDLIPKEEFNKLIKEANFIVTHGGVGSIISSLKMDKKVIAVPRLVEFNEHQSNHQIEIVNLFSGQGYILGAVNLDTLEDKIKEIDRFKPKKYVSDNSLMIKTVTDNLKENKRVLFISSTGGHLEELLQLKDIFPKYKYSLITEKQKQNMPLREKYNNVHYLIYGTKVKPFMYIIKSFFNCIKSVFLYLMIRPDYVVTTGTHTAVPICTLAHMFKKKVIFIETFANHHSQTKAGAFIYNHKICNVFIVQWKDMLELYPNAIYGGSIF